MKPIKFQSSVRLLNKILSDPALPEKIRSLEPKALAKMITEVGLEDCGEIIALATAQQIERVFDEDLWQAPKPGDDEAFDPDRFGLWIEILMELGIESAAKKVAEMDEDFITFAISQLVWAIDFDSLRTEVSIEGRLEKVMDSTAFVEIEDFVVFSRLPRIWDAILNLLIELDQHHHEFLRRILENCVQITTEQIHDHGGLYSVLALEDQLKEDVAYEREKRRETQGYVTPANARAFLKLAAGPLEVEDYVTPKKLRGLAAIAPPLSTLSQKTSVIFTNSTQRFVRLQAWLLSYASTRGPQLEQLNYLANVLVAGWEISGRSPRPGEAAVLVLETCEQGLQVRPDSKSLIEAFRAGWSRGRP